MIEGCRDEGWSYASSVMALVANANRGPKTRPFKPEQFNPMARARVGESPGKPIRVSWEQFEMLMGGVKKE
jgi:hypothetical protein